MSSLTWKKNILAIALFLMAAPFVDESFAKNDTDHNGEQEEQRESRDGADLDEEDPGGWFEASDTITDMMEEGDWIQARAELLKEKSWGNRNWAKGALKEGKTDAATEEKADFLYKEAAQFHSTFLKHFKKLATIQVCVFVASYDTSELPPGSSDRALKAADRTLEELKSLDKAMDEFDDDYPTIASAIDQQLHKKMQELHDSRIEIFVNKSSAGLLKTKGFNDPRCVQAIP